MTGVPSKNTQGGVVGSVDIPRAQMQLRELVEGLQEVFLKALPLGVEPFVVGVVFEELASIGRDGALVQLDRPLNPSRARLGTGPAYQGQELVTVYAPDELWVQEIATVSVHHVLTGGPRAAQSLTQSVEAHVEVVARRS